MTIWIPLKLRKQALLYTLFTQIFYSGGNNALIFSALLQKSCQYARTFVWCFWTYWARAILIFFARDVIGSHESSMGCRPRQLTRLCSHWMRRSIDDSYAHSRNKNDALSCHMFEYFLGDIKAWTRIELKFRRVYSQLTRWRTLNEFLYAVVTKPSQVTRVWIPCFCPLWSGDRSPPRQSSPCFRFAHVLVKQLLLEALVSDRLAHFLACLELRQELHNVCWAPW